MPLLYHHVPQSLIASSGEYIPALLDWELQVSRHRQDQGLCTWQVSDTCFLKK